MILRLYPWMLRLYPKSFYDRFGGEMLDVFEQAWDANHQFVIPTVIFCIREFTELVISISQERWSERSNLMPRKLFRWYLIPFWLLGLSLVAGVVFSWSYWGYIVQPSTTFTAMDTVESISLVKFDENYYPTALPLNDLPHLITPSFPPSQILSYVPANQAIAKEVDTKLADQLARAMTGENINLGRIHMHPTEPVIGVNDCEQCYQLGIQFQADGSYLGIWPEFTHDGQPTGENTSHRVTANEWWYYPTVMPAAYLVTGQAEDGTPLVFLGLASGAIGNDRYHYFEFLFDASDDTLTIRDQLDYRFDIAGLEDYTVATMTLTLFIPLFLALLVLLALKLVISSIQRLIAQRPLVGQA
jgi:hypothetical protein